MLFKSRDAEYKRLHNSLLGAFNEGVDAIRLGALEEARNLFDFPEVGAIGLGYSLHSKRGSGVGTYLGGLIIETLAGSPGLQERGVRHVAEMQLVSAGIGPDRISDIAANVLKRFLIEYTQRQCDLCHIPVQLGVPINHIYNPESHSWDDSYEDLPVSPADGSPILLVPRRLVRALPWINHDNSMRTEFAAYLEARRESARRSRVAVAAGKRDLSATDEKAEIVTITRSDITLIGRYVHSREQQSGDARPAFDYVTKMSAKKPMRSKRGLARFPQVATTQPITRNSYWRY